MTHHTNHPLSLAVDQDGYLLNLVDWTPEVAESLAAHEGIVLSAAHWEVLWLVRRFYQQFDLSPATRALVRYVAQHLGSDKGNGLYLNSLFKGSPAKLGAKLAGLPKPINCL